MYKRFCKSFDSFFQFGRRLGLVVGRFKKSSLLEPVRFDHAAPRTTLQPENEALEFMDNCQLGKPPSPAKAREQGTSFLLKGGAKRHQHRSGAGGAESATHTVKSLPNIRSPLAGIAGRRQNQFHALQVQTWGD